MPYIAKVFTFEETENSKCEVGEAYLQISHIQATKYEGEHDEIKHVLNAHEATHFQTEEEAMKAISQDIQVWTKWHNAFYWPNIKKVIQENNLWGSIQKI